MHEARPRVLQQPRSWLLQNSIRVAPLLDGYLRKGGFCFLARRLRR